MSTVRIAAAAAALLALAACSSGGASSDSRTTDDAGAAAVQEAPAAEYLGSGEESANSAKTAPGAPQADQAKTPTLESPDLIKTATVSIVDKDLDAVRDSLDALLQRYGGSVADEKTTNDKEGNPLTSTLVVRVPTQSFAAVMATLRESKSVKSSSISSEDVHQQVIDVNARLANLRTSLARLRDFLREATDINAMLDFEQRITSVESQIASLTAQRNYLADRTSLSTITLDLRTPKAPPPKPKKEDPLEGAGFLSGLDNGWEALQDVLVVAATVVGAVLPFGVIGAVVGLPLWLALRRRRSASGVRMDEVGEAG